MLSLPAMRIPGMWAAQEPAIPAAKVARLPDANAIAAAQGSRVKAAAAAQGTLLNCIVQQVKYLAMLETSGVYKVDTPQFADKVCGRVGVIMSTIAKQRSVSEDEAMEINELLAHTPQFDDGYRVKIMRAVDQIMQFDGTMNEKPLQTLMCFDKYLTEVLGNLFARDDVPPEEKTKATGVHLCKMGAKHLTEKSWAHVASVTHQNSNLSSEAKLVELRKLKAQVKACNMPGVSGITEFPADPRKFFDNAPTDALRAFGTTPPVESAMDDIARQVLALGFPCRSNNRLCAASQPHKMTQAAAGTPRAFGHMFQEMLGNMHSQNLLLQRQGSRGNQGDAIPLTYFGNAPSTAPPAIGGAPAPDWAVQWADRHRLASDRRALGDAQSPSTAQSPTTSAPSTADESQSPMPPALPKMVVDIHAITAKLQARNGKKTDDDDDDEDDCSTPWHYFD